MKRLKRAQLPAFALLLTSVQADEARAFPEIPGAIVDSARPGIRFPAAERSVESTEPIVIPHDVSSVCSLWIDDGPAAVDVSFNAGIQQAGGPCGFVKEGGGTLRVAGEIRLSGFITVAAGILDLSAARPAAPLRIHLTGDARLIPPPADTSPVELHLNGVKLSPGTMGPQDSPMLGGPVRVMDSGPSRREIWKGLKYGIFSHYVWNGYGMTSLVPKEDGTIPGNIDELAEALDVPNYVDQLVAAGAQYVVFTAWHSGTCPLFPSAAMAKWAPDRRSCPKRDLLGEVLDECRKRGLRSFFYCHPYQPVVEPHNDWINDLFAELVDRYGDRLDGLWLDENFQDCTQDKLVDYRRLMRTIKERNPDLVLTQNNGGSQAYGVDEGVQEVQWEFHEGRRVSTYQIFGQTAKSPEDMLVTTVIQAAANTLGGGVQWSIDAHGAGTTGRGGLDKSARPILDAFAKLLEPVADSVKDTRPSDSYPPRFSGAVVRLSNLDWGVATRSADGSREYLHVLKPPAGSTLRLPPPADGKVFGKARLLDGGRALSLSQSSRGIAITLPDGMTWKSPDTVIVMDVIAPGGVGLVNDTSLAVEYRGTSWTYSRTGTSGEFRADSHRCSSDGDSFSFHFEGTDVEWISARGSDRGMVEIAIDGVSQGSVDLSQGERTSTSVFSKKGLPRGHHTLTATKRGGAIMSVDAFKVSDLVNDSDPALRFSDQTRYGARAAALEGPWEPREAAWINGHSFSFTFHGTAVEILGGAAHGSGDLVLTLDGQEHSTVRCHGGQESRGLANISGLPLGQHTLKGHYANPSPSGFIPALDGFAVTRPDFWNQAKGRGLGELGDDVHVGAIQGATGSFTFDGSGVEIITTRDPESRTVHYTLDGDGSSLWVGLNHHSAATVPGAIVFSDPNLRPGRYTVGFSNAANPSGLNFSNVRMNIDAIRIHKGESPSARPLFWGPDKRGGSGVWDSGASANWNDGAAAAKWQDFGAADHQAVFGGKGGTIEVAAAVRVNRLVFQADGYLLRGGAIELTGGQPVIEVARSVTATLSLPVRSAGGVQLPAGKYTAATHPELIEGEGLLIITDPS